MSEEKAGEQQIALREISQYKKLGPKQVAFLAAYAEIGTITHAALAAGIERRSHYNWLKDEDYREAWEVAHLAACETLELEARRRAREGWDEPVFHDGVICGYKRKFSDTLLIFLLKGALPQKYRDNVHAEVEAGDSGGFVLVLPRNGTEPQ